MNVITAIMLVFALVGFIDKTFSLKWGLSDQFDKGLACMSSMLIPIVSICCIGVEFIQRHTEQIAAISNSSPIDPTFIIGVLLAPDFGSYFVCREMTSSQELIVLNGIILGTLLGQAICFQLPVFLSSIDRVDRPIMLRGFLLGMVVIPAGLIAAELIFHADLVLFLKQLIPVLILCLLLALGLIRIPKAMVKGFSVFGRAFLLLTYFMFFLTILGIFVPKFCYYDMDSLYEALIILVKSAIIISGSLVMSSLILKFFRKYIQKAAVRLGVNEISLICLLMNCATSLAILPLFSRMDKKGKLMNSAFAISGSYIIGGSMAFVSSVSPGFVVAIFLVSKAVCGILSILLVHLTFHEKAGDD